MKKSKQDFAGIPPAPAPLPDAEVIDIQSLYEDLRVKKVELVCVLGPTASGKTRYAVNLAKKFNSLAGKPVAEILSADSRQVYKGLDIGSGKDLEEYGEIPVHLLDLLPAGGNFNLYDYCKAFRKAFDRVAENGGIPILCGGTGLYIEAAVKGYKLPLVAPDEELREELESLDTVELAKRLESLSVEVKAETLLSRRRMIRAIELAESELKTLPSDEDDDFDNSAIKTFFIGTLVDKETRNKLIDKRLDKRLGIVSTDVDGSFAFEGDEGGALVSEVRGLLESGVQASSLIAYGLEYKFVTLFLQGVLSFPEMRKLLGIAIHQFAKRQMTWFRGMERRGEKIHWTCTN